MDFSILVSLSTFTHRWPPRSAAQPQHRTHPLISPELGLQQGVNNISRNIILFLTTSATVFIFINRMFKDLYKQVSQFKVVRLCLNNACLWYEIACWLEEYCENYLEILLAPSTPPSQHHTLRQLQICFVFVEADTWRVLVYFYTVNKNHEPWC